jgi:putative two-component system response regulator
MNDSKGKILVVDDAEINLDILVAFLSADYDVSVAMNGPAALQACAALKPDLILLDVMMPGMDGYEVCRRIKENQLTSDIPVIFITTLSDVDDESKGLALGAVDYIRKPFKPALLKARIGNHLALKYYQNNLNAIIADKVHTVQGLRDAAIRGMAIVAEFREPETGFHIQRTREYVRFLADRSVENGTMGRTTAELLTQVAPLHDIGKVGISDAILFKPGKLTDEEFTEMKNHVRYGAEAIQRIEKGQEGSALMRAAAEVVEFHHEKWDGSGYLKGLSRHKIPIGARIMMVADVYDALVNVRPYKPAFSHETALNIIATNSGAYFDPDLVGIFLQHHREFERIARQYAG